MKKILSFVLSLVLLFSLIPAGSIGVIANALSEYPVLSYGETVSFDLVGYETTKDYQFTPERTCDYNVYIYQSEEDSCSYKITVYYENGNIYDWYYSYGAYYFRFYLNAEETYRICVENQRTGTAHYELKVIEPPVADSITIDNDDRYPRFVGESEDIYTSQTPLGSIYAAKTWESTNESVVYVADYMLYFASEGTATITATTNNGLSDSKTFTVLSTTDISLNSEKVIDVSEHKGFAMFTFVPDTDGIYSFSVYNQQFPVGATVKDEYMYDIDSNISDSTFELQFEATANTQYYIKTVTYDENLVTGTYNVKLNKKVPASSVTIKPGNTLNLYRGMRYCLEAVLNPEGCINENIQWNSDNENVVEVDDWGEIKTVGIGSAVITARTENGLTDTLTVVVNTSDEIALDETKTNFVTADNPIGAYEFVPTENGYYRISVRCDDENYTSVNTLGCYEVMGTSGYVTSFVAQLEANEAYNIITTFFEEGNHSYSVKIEKLVPANSVVIGNGDVQGRVGGDFWLWVEFGPENHIEESYSFSSNNPAVADVTDDGWVQFISEGNTTITVTSENGLTNTINVTVLPQLLASSMKINGPEFKTAFVGIQECYSVDFEPMECSAEEVTWYSNDEEIATIDGGCINFLKEGTVIITAVSENGLVDSCTVQVKSMPVISPLNPVNISITNNQGEYMKYISDGNKTVRFYASDLSNDNEVKFEVYDEYYCWVAHGYDFVDLDVLDGDIYYIVADYYSYADMGNGSFKVNAVELVEAEDMNITSDTITGYEGLYEQLEVEFAPFNAITENVVWESGNQAIATVEGGTVKYISEGTTTITATSENGLVATATVTVIGATEIEVNEKKNDSVTQSVRGKSFKFTPEEDGCYQVKIDSEINLYVYVCATDSDEYLNYGWDYIMNLPVELEGGNTYLICAEPNWLAQQGDFEIIIEKMVPATSMEILEGESYYGYVGDTTMLSVSFNPENAIYEEITWESDNEDAVLVDEYGYIELLAEGEATVTATSENGLSATINIVSLSPKTITLNEDVDVLIDENVDSRRFKFTPQVTANYLLDINSDKVVEVWIENNDEDTYFSELAYESIVLELQAGVTYDIIAGYMANYTGSFTFKMSEAPEVTGLEIISLPYRMNYYAECMEFYYDGLQLKATFSNDTFAFWRYNYDYTIGGFEVGIEEIFDDGDYIKSVITCGTVSVDMSFNVTDSDVTSIEVVEGTKYNYIENCDGYEIMGNFRYNQRYPYDAKIKINYKNGTHVIKQIGEYVNGYEITWDSNQDVTPWVVGNNNVSIVRYADKEAVLPITVLENRVESIEIVSGELTLYENCDGYKHDGVFYYNYNVPEDVTIKINYIGGGSETVCMDGAVDGTYFNCSDEQFTQPWIKGGENFVTIEYRGAKAKLAVNIVENPVDHIEINTAPSRVYIYGDAEYGEFYADEYWIYPYDMSGLLFTVYYTDNTHKTFTSADIEDGDYIDGHYIQLIFDDYCEGIGNKEIELEYMGKTAGYNISIIDSPIKDFAITKLPAKTKYNDMFVPDFVGAQFTITHSDYSTEVIDVTKDNLVYEYAYYSNPIAFLVEAQDGVISIYYDYECDCYVASYKGFVCEFDGIEYENGVPVISVEAESFTPGGNGVKFKFNYADGTSEIIDVSSDIIYKKQQYDLLTIVARTENGIIEYDILTNITNGNEVWYYEVYVNGYNMAVVPAEYIIGDLDGNGEVEISDLAQLKLYLAGALDLEDNFKLAADINKSGDVEIGDLAMMKLYLAGAITLE